MAVMDHIVRASTACLAVIAGALAVLASAGSAAAATPCAQRVIDDWADNGRIDRVYPLPCYEEAIDGIPVDLRDYTNAADVIGRALTAAARVGNGGDGAGGAGAGDSAAGTEAAASIDTSGASDLPRALLVLVGVSLVVLAAGAAGHLSRRRRTAPPRESTAD